MSDLSPEDEGVYTVKASNTVGTVECVAEVLVVSEAPEFISPLETQTVSVSDTVHFECRVTGRPTPTVKWFAGTAELADTHKYHTEFSDQTAILEIKNVTLDDAEMTYTAKALNLAGEATVTANIIVQGVLSIQWLLRVTLHAILIVAIQSYIFCCRLKTLNHTLASVDKYSAKQVPVYYVH